MDREAALAAAQRLTGALEEGNRALRRLAHEAARPPPGPEELALRRHAAGLSRTAGSLALLRATLLEL
eukprot:CAMPEP_0204164902 /NCGR_PEP_ID=MMETSP0361-20130328/37687_1 /ASSEMBLY_ACC=CAM_ASM_000343 /TAXON_ID=268821 /ORGANISM="Scrippsiella Hangoei, Strain SHTV-5" /LENGTH=67 /DNA_ID=CAMNT_0051121843 /DNA_START=91 /DNA_END=291 /DNA_ORIENTATION=-